MCPHQCARGRGRPGSPGRMWHGPRQPRLGGGVGERCDWKAGSLRRSVGSEVGCGRVQGGWGGPVRVRAPGLQTQVPLVPVGWRKNRWVCRKSWSSDLGDSGGDRAQVSSHSRRPWHTSAACFYKHFVCPSVRGIRLGPCRVLG